MKAFSSALVTATCLLAGCTFSAHPILTTVDLTKDLDLSGKWKSQPVGSERASEPRPVITLKTNDRNTSYDAVVDGRDNAFDLRIGKLGDRRYLEVTQSNLPIADAFPALPPFTGLHDLK